MSTFKFKVNVIASERGWGKELLRTAEFDTHDEAVEFMDGINSKNTLDEAPDYYKYAEADNFTPEKKRPSVSVVDPIFMDGDEHLTT